MSPGEKQAASRNALALSSMMPGIELIQGAACASGATVWEAAIASAMASDQTGVERAGFGQMVDGLTFVEAAHFNGIFDRLTLAVDLKRSVAALGDRNHAMVDLRRELADLS